MTQENNSNTTTFLTEVHYDSLMTKFDELETTLDPYMQFLTIAERKSLVKMGDKSTAFVGKTIHYAKEHNSLIPDVLDVEMLKKHYEQTQQLEHLVRKVEKLLEGLSDARMTSANKAYSTSLKVYRILRAASELEVPGIKSAIEDLGKRFNKQGKKADAELMTPDEQPSDQNEVQQVSTRSFVLNENGRKN